MRTDQQIAGRKAEIGPIGIASDHGGFDLKQYLVSSLQAVGYKILDFGAYELVMEDDYPDFIMNVLCLGGRVTGQALSLDLTTSFLDARFTGSERFRRRLKKLEALENKKYDLLDIIY